jgi:hypothetical protein
LVICLAFNPRPVRSAVRAACRGEGPYCSGLVLRRERSKARWRSRARLAARAAAACWAVSQVICSIANCSGCPAGKEASARFDTFASTPAHRSAGISARRDRVAGD